MLNKIYKYELGNILKKPSTYLFITAFFSLALVSMLGTGGYFDGVDPSDKQQRLLNSPESINDLLQYFNKFYLFLIPTIIGTTIFRDYKSRAFHIIYSYPIKKFDYLVGKFLAGYSIVAAITIVVGLAMIIGEFILGTENPKIGGFNLMGYLNVYVIFILPNMLIYGLLIFAIIAASRNIYAGFITAILFFFFQIIGENVFSNQPFLIALFDPFAQNTVSYITHLWTFAEKNTQQIPILGIVLYNRLLWLAISSSIFYFFYRKFSFSQESFLSDFSRKTKKQKTDASEKNKSSVVGLSVLDINYSFSRTDQFRSMFRLSTIEYYAIVRNWMFYFLVGFGILAVVFAIGRVTNNGDLILLPLTRLMLTVPMLFFTGIITLCTFLFSGMLVHRASMSRSDQLVDTTPTSNWVLLGSKIIALAKMQLTLLMILLCSGIAIQIYNGYYHFELSLYLFQLFLLTFPTLLIWAICSVFVHTFIQNIYLSIFVLILGWISIGQLSNIGLDSLIFKFNSPPQFIYSDMNGFGNHLSGHFLITSYWMIFAGLTMIGTYLLWQRGIQTSIPERIRMVKKRISGKILASGLTLFVLFLMLGFKIYSEENHPDNPLPLKGVLDKFKTNFSPYKDAAQPKITSLHLEVDLFPKRQSFFAKGQYLLVNKTNRLIDTLLVKTGFDEKTSYTFDQESLLINEDSIFQFKAILLKQSLPPGDSLLFDFTIENKSNSLFSRNSSTLSNGTFLRTDILPRFGYFADAGEKHPTDSLAGSESFYAVDADNLPMETIVSTSSDQTAIAPGYLKKSWTKDDRNYFHYITQQDIKIAYAINSGKFSKHQETYKDITLEIYYHQPHDYNLNTMIEGLKAALDYNTQYFSPYQHQEARIIEFPYSEGTYATVMANSIPISEQRFIINSDHESNQYDLAFYVPAHEFTHQWWGNQVTPSNAKGAKMLTESITEYITLQLYEKYFGKDKAVTFLKNQHQRYLRGRTRETAIEPPLYLVNANQDYIAYGKGTVAFNTIKHYWGEEKVNQMLQIFLKRYQFNTTTFPGSTDLIQLLKDSIPYQYQYLITDMMEEVIFYETQITKATYKENPENKYSVSLNFEIKKTRPDQPEEILTLNDFIELGFYNQQGELFHTEQVLVDNMENTLELSLDQLPEKVILDPNFLLIEKDRVDNSIDFTFE